MTSSVKKNRNANEQIEYQNLLAEWVARIRNGEMTSYRAAKLSSK